MLYIPASENALAPGVAELHLQPSEDITVIFPDGQELYVSGDGEVTDNFGKTLSRRSEEIIEGEGS